MKLNLIIVVIVVQSCKILIMGKRLRCNISGLLIVALCWLRDYFPKKKEANRFPKTKVLFFQHFSFFKDLFYDPPMDRANYQIVLVCNET